MIRISKWLMFFSIGLGGHATHFDIFGASPTLATAFMKEYAKKIEWIERRRLLAASFDLSSDEEVAEIKKLKEKIKQQFHFQDLSIDSVLYPKQAEVFTTVSICTQPIQAYPQQVYPSNNKRDLMDRMHFFIIKAAKFMVHHPELSDQLYCRDEHCLTPEHPDFKQDLEFFRQQVPKHKTLIEFTALHDPIFERRRAAIFLLPYLPHPEQNAVILTTLLDDESAFIRHDALRVYGELVAKHPKMPVELPKVVNSLFSCHAVERNKALILLNELAKQTHYQKPILQLAGKPLIHLLKLQQPNNHQFAYRILQQISHKSFGQRDYPAWKIWLKQALASEVGTQGNRIC